ncbi:MAG TPA: TGS domain-containing protein [Nostocaceae cyanobacterium]|nr:TGS domain-containing protein [Nostocaceae cyanobacterium]
MSHQLLTIINQQNAKVNNNKHEPYQYASEFIAKVRDNHASKFIAKLGDYTPEEEQQGKFVFVLIYEIMSDSSEKNYPEANHEAFFTAISGLLYTLKLLEEEIVNYCDEYFNCASVIKYFLKSIDKLTDLVSQEKINCLNNNDTEGILDKKLDVEEIIMMIFVYMNQQQDIKALVIELVYRLSILKYIKYIKFDNNQEKINFAFQTFKIFVPIANRLGLWRLKWELEDLSFKQIENKVYSQIAHSLKEKRSQREEYTDNCVNHIKTLLIENGLTTEQFTIKGRPKSIFSTYSKMKKLYSHEQYLVDSKLSFHEFNNLLKANSKIFKKLFEGVHDLFGIRIICDNITNCYKILDIIQQNLQRQPTLLRKYGEWADYIAAPKPNKYQSIHLVVKAPYFPEDETSNDRKIEVQIRTYQMHQEAEYGIAAHWKYKEIGYSNSTSSRDYVFTQLKEFIDHRGVAAVRNFITDLDSNLFGSNIYVFTPQGKVICLKKDSTPVDFAYAIHTDVGNHCSQAKVNGQKVPLSQKLDNGDIVEITTHKNAKPSLDWINFVQSSKTKNKIKAWFKQVHREESISNGWVLLKDALTKNQIKISSNSKLLLEVANKLNYQHSQDLLAALGTQEKSVGEKGISINQVVNYLREIIQEIGKGILATDLAKNQLEIWLNSEFMQKEIIESELKYQCLEDLYMAISGYTDKTLSSVQVVNLLKQKLQEKKINDTDPVEIISPSDRKSNKKSGNDSEKSTHHTSPIIGVEGIKYHRAHCCQPIPGENIIGIVKNGQDISIHNQHCKNIIKLKEAGNPHIIEVSWNPAVSQTYPVDIQVETSNDVDIVKEVKSCFAEQNISIRRFKLKTYPSGNKCLINLSIDITDSQQLEKCEASLIKNRNVIQVYRLSEVNIDYDVSIN